MKLSPAMLVALRRLDAAGPTGTLRRWPGGYWTTEERPTAPELAIGIPAASPAWHTTTATVRALAARGLLEPCGYVSCRELDHFRLTAAGRHLLAVTP